MSICRSRRAGAAVFAALLAVAAGQGPAAAQGTAPAGDRFTVHLVTMSPGEAVWERFGHNGLWVEDHLTGTDTFFEWGVFSFQQVNFVARLIRGEMLYSMDVAPLAEKLAIYRSRTVWADELALTPGQETDLIAALAVNAQEGNREYIYDYYDDNCSTRVRDMLDREGVLGGALRAAVEGEETDRSWRWHTLRLLQGQPWAYYGIHIAFGQPADRTIDRWEETFLPLKLRDVVRGAEVPDGAGGMRPLVVGETLLSDAGSLPADRKPAWLLPATLVGLLAAGGLVLLGSWGRRSAVGRAALGVVGFAVAAFLGVAGTVMLGLWFFTDHDPAAWNEGVLQATPVHFALAVLLLPLVIGRRPGATTVRLARWLSALALLGLLLKVLPLFSQSNLELLVITIPVQLGLAGAVARAALPRPVDRG